MWGAAGHYGQHRECGGAEAAGPLPPRGAACGGRGVRQAPGWYWGPPREDASREGCNTGDAEGVTVFHILELG